MKNRLKKISVLFLVFVLAVSWGGAALARPDNSTVLLHPSGTVNGIKVQVGEKINGYPIARINGYDITVDLGKYNVSLQSFRIPYASELWELPSGTTVDYVSWAGNGSSNRSEGASALLANGGNSAYYFFKTAQYRKFVLKYDANGGTGAPAAQEYQATSQYEYSHTFTISSVTPTREDYTFLGWSTSPTAAAAERQPGGSIVVSGTTTLYAVWQRNAVNPNAPGENEVLALLQSGAVKISCINTGAVHGNQTYGLLAGGFSIGAVEGDAASGYTCQITVTPAAYVSQYSTDKSAVHTLAPAGQGNKAITLLYRDGAWTVNTALPVTFTVECEPQAPEIPTGPAPEVLKELLKVEVSCADSAGHGARQYDLAAGSYTVGAVARDVDGDRYTVTVTGVTPGPYVDLYNQEFTGHRFQTGDTGAAKILVWDGETWQLPEGGDGLFRLTMTCRTETLYTVSFDSQGGSSVAPLTNIVPGSRITQPAQPVRNQYRFTGWYREAACINLWAFDADTVQSNLWLYAGWEYVGGGPAAETRIRITYDAGSQGRIVSVQGAVESLTTTQARELLPLGDHTSNITVTVASNDGVRFTGWALEGGTLVDPAAYYALSDTTFYAVYEQEGLGDEVVSEPTEEAATEEPVEENGGEEEAVPEEIPATGDEPAGISLLLWILPAAALLAVRRRARPY